MFFPCIDKSSDPKFIFLVLGQSIASLNYGHAIHQTKQPSKNKEVPFLFLNQTYRLAE